MCGICGFLNNDLNPNPAKKILHNMCQVMSHRGPDDEGTYLTQHVAMGMRRLSIIDLQTGHQPIANEDRSIHLVINGEIYNFPELKKDLIKRGHQFSTESDSEVLVHLYEDYGIECLHKINGMFAFAIWDEKKRSLFLARDRIGIKPLYYSAGNNQFIFGSEIKSLLQHPLIKKELDLEALNLYLTYEYIPSPLSIFKNIKKLPPGHFLTITHQGDFTIRQYWDFNYCDKIQLKSEGEYVEALKEKLFCSVKRRIISDVPLGAFLSGGIDSGMIASVMQKLNPGKVDSFNIGFREKSFDESSFSKTLAGYLAINHRSQIFDTQAMIDLIPNLAEVLDEPLADNSILPTYLLCQFCRQHVTVALSGDGGDELFAGYPTYQAHKLADFYSLIPLSFRQGLIERIIRSLPVSTDNFSLDFKAKKFISGTTYPYDIRHHIWLGAFTPDEKKEIFHPAVNETLAGKDEFSVIRNLLKSAKVETRLDVILYLDMKLYLQEDLLVKVDRASMANSLEVRVPFLDHEFVDFATRLPDNMKLRFLKTKYLLKQAARGLIPSTIINRKKKGFGAPVAKWIKGELKDLFMDTLSKGKITREGIFNYPYIEGLLNGHLEGKSDNRQKLWTLFVFELWFDRYLAGN